VMAIGDWNSPSFRRCHEIQSRRVHPNSKGTRIRTNDCGEYS
jgi:hypothetical protein